MAKTIVAKRPATTDRATAKLFDTAPFSGGAGAGFSDGDGAGGP